MSTTLDGLHILLVEDEYLIALDVETICLDHGATQVTIAGRLAELQDRSLTDGVDAAIVDLMINGVPTLNFAARLQQQGIPFIFATGHMMTDDIRARFPHVELVEKPYSGDDLVRALAAAHRAAPSQSAGDVIT